MKPFSESQPLRVERYFPFGRDIGETDVVCIEPGETLSEAVRLMRDEQVGDLVVIERDGERTHPIGMVTDRDVALAVDTAGAGDLTVSDVMTHTVATANITEDVFAIARKMKEFGVARMPVIDDEGALKGIVTAKKLMQVFLQGLNDLASLSKRQQENEHSIQH